MISCMLENLLAKHCLRFSQMLIEKAVHLIVLGITDCELSLPGFGITAYDASFNL